MKRGKVASFTINGEYIRVVIEQLHRDGTATVRALNDPYMGIMMRFLVQHLNEERYPDVERALQRVAPRHS